jgi:WD40 repeat protein
MTKYGLYQLNIAERRQRLSLAQTLTSLSQEVYQDSFDSELSALLAIEAYHIDHEEAGDISGFIDSALRPLLMSERLYFNATLRGHESDVGSVAFSPDGRFLASSSNDQSIRLWNLAAPQAEPLVLGGYESSRRSVAFSPDGRFLASGGADRLIRVWNLSVLDAEPLIFRSPEPGVWSVAFSPDGKSLASSSADQTIRL